MKPLQRARAFLGNGFAFPLQIGAGGGFVFAAYEADIEQSVFGILSTAKGERVMVPDFGCGMHDLVFSPNTSTQAGAVASEVREALVRWEPRIDVDDINVSIGGDQGQVLLIRIDYRIRSNNAFYNVVYPFFIRDPQTLASQESARAISGS
jgi:phage baseplate assembly protein W